MVAIVTASILPSYAIPHNSPSPPPPPAAVAIPPLFTTFAILTIPHPLSPQTPHRYPPPTSPLHPSSALVVFSLLTLCSFYSIPSPPSPNLLFPDTTSADIKLRYQLPRRQTTARSPAMNLRVGARVLCSLSVDGVNIGRAVRARVHTAGKRSHSRASASTYP